MAHTLSNKQFEQQFLQFLSTPPQKFYQRYPSHSTCPQTLYCTIRWATFHIDAASNLTLASRNPQGKLAKRAHHPWQDVSVDLSGKMRTQGITNVYYFIPFRVQLLRCQECEGPRCRKSLCRTEIGGGTGPASKSALGLSDVNK